MTSFFSRLLYKLKSLYDLVQYKYLKSPKTQNTIDEFHKLYYNLGRTGSTWTDNYFLGTQVQKCPLDLFIYQEIIYKLKPDLIIETGTASGGSALFMATILDSIGKGEIVTVDIEKFENTPEHKRIKYLVGSSTDKDIIKKIENAANNKKVIFVILDSNHSRDHVSAELKIYPRFVTKDSYLVVEDSNVNGNPVFSEHGPGPMEALNEFLDNTNDFVVDNYYCEKSLLTFNPRGYLRKV